MFKSLELAVKNGGAEALQLALYDLEQSFSGEIPDAVSFKIIDILQRDEMFSSDLSGHLLNYFEDNRNRLSNTVKEKCIGFIRDFGHRFSHVHSSHVIAELREGRYLDTPNNGFLPPRKPRRNDV